MFQKICLESGIVGENKEIVSYFRKEFAAVEISTTVKVNNEDGNVLYIGKTEKFLSAAEEKNAVIALLNDEEDLFSFTYAVEDIFSIDYSYVEMIYCRYNKIPLKIAETTRLFIKEMDMAAAKYFYELSAENPYIFAQNNTDKNNCEIEEMAAAYIEKNYGFYGYGIWALYEKTSGKPAGFAGVSNFDIEGENGLMLSYYIEEKLRGCGFAYEACEAVLKYCKEKLEIDEIFCLISKDNIPSINTAKKLLFKPLKNITKINSILYLRKL